MKRILITGKDSYIGTSFEKWICQKEFLNYYSIDTIDMRDTEWKKISFSDYDSILHVAGIVHQKETLKNAYLYYEINRDLAVKVAKKAKKEGVKQFILLSSMGIYGEVEGIITKETLANPVTHYGKSKWQAEIAIKEMENEKFKVAIIRPPMVYGKGCKGNYPKLSWVAKHSPLFPYTTNERSMVYIENLCEFIRTIVEEEKQGVFLPQNAEYVNVSDMVKRIASIAGHRIFIIKGISTPIRLLGGTTAKKVLGTLVYDCEKDKCSTVAYGETIIATERIGEVTDHISFAGKKLLVLMSAYNGEEYIREQVLSILKQKTSLEIFIRIRDDGSKDKTCEIISKLQEQYPKRIDLIRGENIGCNASFFELINGASGYDYYAISDQDDVWMQGKLQNACEYLSREGNAQPLLYASTSYLVDRKLRPYGITKKKEREFTIYNTIIQNICPGHSQVMNNALLKKIQGKIDFSRIYVYDSWITNMAILYGKIIFNNTPYTYYRQHNRNQLGATNGEFGQLLKSAERVRKGDGYKYREQIRYFIEYNETELQKQGYYNELTKYVLAKTLKERFHYTLYGKLYRQKKIETIAFYVAVLMGRF